MLAPAPRLTPLVVLHPQCPAARLLKPHTAVAASHAPHTLLTRSPHGPHTAVAASPVVEASRYSVRSWWPRCLMIWQAVSGRQQKAAQQSSHSPQHDGGMECAARTAARTVITSATSISHVSDDVPSTNAQYAGTCCDDEACGAGRASQRTLPPLVVQRTFGPALGQPLCAPDAKSDATANRPTMRKHEYGCRLTRWKSCISKQQN